MIPFIVFSGIVNWILVTIGDIILPDNTLISEQLAHQITLKSTDIWFTVFIAMMASFIATFVTSRSEFYISYSMLQIEAFFQHLKI